MKLIIGNQKTYLNLEGVEEFINLVKSNINESVIICPSYIYVDRYINAGFNVGVQNISDKSNGAFTGEISVNQIKSLDIGYSIVGHSEVRMTSTETNSVISNKVKCLLDNNIVPILCIGETLSERELGITKEVLYKELDAVYLICEDASNIIIAYEPIWSIGTGVIPTNEEIEATVLAIKQYVLDKYMVNPKVLYGGSVNKSNIELLNQISVVDGYLIGGASAKTDEFNYIIETCK